MEGESVVDVVVVCLAPWGWVNSISTKEGRGF